MGETGKPEGAPVGWNDPFDLENYLGEGSVQSADQPAMKTKTVMPDAELKPCPFCGISASVEESEFLDDVFRVRCNGEKCGCSLSEHRTFSSEVEAIDAWNRRASVAAGARTETPEVEALVKAAERVEKLFKEALPKFNWGASALDANAITLLNEVPGEVHRALLPFRGA